MYSNKLVACIKVDGKILRENKEVVALPFGSEYSIFIKNMASVRAQVRISIDGEEKTSGWVVIQPYGSVEIERSIVNGNLSQGHRFKFIERTEAIENYRGIKAEDGLIRIDFKFEKVLDPIYVPYTTDFKWYNGVQIGSNYTRGMGSMVKSSTYNCCSTPQSFSNTAGITAEGSVSDQKFQYTSWFPTEDKTNVLVLKLVGEINEVEVVEPITVKTKNKCQNCGMLNPFGNRFCPSCGTGLQII